MFSALSLLRWTTTVLKLLSFCISNMHVSCPVCMVDEFTFPYNSTLITTRFDVLVFDIYKLCRLPVHI